MLETLTSFYQSFFAYKLYIYIWYIYPTYARAYVYFLINAVTLATGSCILRKCAIRTSLHFTNLTMLSINYPLIYFTQQCFLAFRKTNHVPFFTDILNGIWEKLSMKAMKTCKFSNNRSLLSDDLRKSTNQGESGATFWQRLRDWRFVT